MIAYHGKTSVKAKYVKRVKQHYELDEIAQGYYWENGKGCAVGCTIEGSDHSKYETELGIPSELAYLEDGLFEELKNGDAKEFPLRFLKAIKPGADLSLITSQFMIWQFEDKKYGIKHIKEVKEDKEVYGFCKEVVALYKRKLKGDTPTEDEFYELYKKIDRARAGAWAGAGAWARAGAWAGAWAWARAGAGAWAWARAGAGAWAWARADYDKAYNECIKASADKLIELLENAPSSVNDTALRAKDKPRSKLAHPAPQERKED
jgi:hypothetical protein